MMHYPLVVALDDIAAAGLIAVPVTFTDGVAHVAQDIPVDVAGMVLPRALSAEWCAGRGLKADAGSAVTLPAFDGPSVTLVSLGTSDEEANNYRLAAASAVRAARGAAVAFLLPTSSIANAGDMAQAVVEGAVLASYDYKKPEDDAQLFIVALGTPLPSVETHGDVVAGVRRGAVIAECANWAKRLIDTPPNFMTPKELARQFAIRLSDLADVEVDVWTESRLREERMGGVLGVSAGSAEPARVVIASYEPENAVAHYALVGKGVTFDSGGLAIKPLPGMVEMKTDMSGAAIVAGVIAAVATLKLPVRLTVVTPLVENMSGDRAVKPSDVLTSRAGITMEVINPDAEGRLILADGLTVAVEKEPDAVIDVATLTGAMAMSLGDDCAGFFSTSASLTAGLEAAAAASGEGFWEMPLIASYEKNIKSDVADIKNLGKLGGTGGAIVAALFLQHFTNGLPWAHLDIAGPARSGSTHGYLNEGATAWGMRTLVALLSDVAATAN